MSTSDRAFEDLEQHELEELISDACSDNTDVSGAAIVKLGKLAQEGRLNIDEKGDGLQIRVANPGSPVFVIASASVVMTLLGVAISWVLLLGIDAIGLASMPERIIVFAIVCRTLVQSHREVLHEEFSRVRSRFEWGVISGVFLIEFALSAYFLLIAA